jgi:O-antigen/teichoic acid export membrane protein
VRYSSATVLVMLAGLISFPALTRLLDNTQYGILGYYDTWMMMAAAVIKLGPSTPSFVCIRSAATIRA